MRGVGGPDKHHDAHHGRRALLDGPVNPYAHPLSPIPHLDVCADPRPTRRDVAKGTIARSPPSACPRFCWSRLCQCAREQTWTAHTLGSSFECRRRTEHPVQHVLRERYPHDDLAARSQKACHDARATCQPTGFITERATGRQDMCT